MNDIARAEAYRDQLHDLPDMPPNQNEIDSFARELADEYFDRCVDKEDCRELWTDMHWESFCGEAKRQLGELRDED